MEKIKEVRYKKPPTLRGLDYQIDFTLKRLSIELSRKCNLRCIYCYVNSKIDDELSLNDIKNVILQAKDIGVITITLIGGEPLLYPNLEELVSFIDEQGLIPLIFTNGTIMNKKLAMFLLLKNVSIIVKVNSMDDSGIQKKLAGNIDGVFEKIHNTLSFLIDVGFNKHNPTRMGIESVITVDNISQIEKIFLYARDNNIYPFLELVTPSGRGKKYSGILSAEMAKEVFYSLLKIDQDKYGYTWIPRPPIAVSPCNYYYSAIYVTASGNVQPCPATDIVLGNIKNEKLSVILNKDITKKIRNIRENVKGKCKDCNYNFDCYGCRAAAYNITGDIFAEYPYCWY